GGAAADVDDRATELLLVRSENRLCARELLQNYLFDPHLRAVDSVDQVLNQRALAGYDVNVDIESGPREADRVGDLTAIVEKKLLRQDVDDVALRRDRNRLGREDDLGYIVGCDFVMLSLDRDRPVAVEALDVISRQADRDPVDR